MNTVTVDPGRAAAQLHGLRDRAPAVRIHLELDAVAPQPPVAPELHLLELRDLLHQNGDPHTVRLWDAKR